MSDVSTGPPIVTRLLRQWSRFSRKITLHITVAALVVILVLTGHTVSAQLRGEAPSQPLASLEGVPIPEPDNLNNFIKDKVAAIALGKSLFWDMQLGSDGIQSCASCHFHAGADNRSKNQLNPGLGNIFNIGGAPNYQLTVADYPFHKLADPNNRKSNVLSDSNDITGSQGVFKSRFVDVVVGSDKDNVTPEPDREFNVNGTNVRQVTGRNSPTTINAVFNFRNFWDGRAQNIFNGVNEWGLRDRNAFVLRANRPNRLADVRVRLKNSSLASQAVGPPLSAFETFAENDDIIAPFRVDVSETDNQVTVSRVNEPETIGTTVEATGTDDADESTQEASTNQSVRFRRFGRKLGKKLIALKPLAKQVVHPDDSVLGRYRAPDKGLNKTYDAMIQEAFQPEWWNSNIVVQINPNTGERTFIPKPNRPLTTTEYTLSEYNFSLFFGLAVQAYEATLVSDNAPIDQYLEGNTRALTNQQRRGLEIFENKGKCINCHGGAEFTNASVKNVQNERLERMEMGDGGEAVYDNGFYNIAVRPTQEDLGVGGTEPEEIGGKPLSESRLAQQGLFRQFLGIQPNIRVNRNQRVAVDGAFKTPGLRNVELTAPYFHNGGQLTLEQVVEFYNRGGDFNEQNIANLDPDIQRLGLSAQEKSDLVAFLKALTDERVRLEKAPFDHPQLFVPNGHPGNQNSVTNDGKGQATDQLLEIPAVGRNGGSGTPNFLAN
ncbi:cytochrome-c peroxidase [Iningainema tapete]|uniref:Cytochrome C peroxidase n=1 Tax=Iningainema tapete BLCC-T55 TaxID=2748662 RepID=A0A8J6XFB4_9CYAN|nr:cytochrome c peroxidase [Iningainema tapete]MBD2771865.1 cytochrome C peroxidase [Iningainema tapete BLCC-T55]